MNSEPEQAMRDATEAGRMEAEPVDGDDEGMMVCGHLGREWSYGWRGCMACARVRADQSVANERFWRQGP
jgi:hypothetical protein